MKRINTTDPWARRRNAESQAGLPCVLYVEDDEMNWNVTSLRLASRYRLIWASTDRLACSVLQSRLHEVRAILMDIQLRDSRLNGVELTRLLRGKPLTNGYVPSYAEGLPRVDLPIFFVTAAGHEYSEDALMAEGGNGLITKPVDFVRLNLALANALASRVTSGG